MSTVYCGNIIWTWVVKHRVPIRKHQHAAGTDGKDAHWLTHEQGDDGCHTALKQRSDVLGKSTGAGETGAQSQSNVSASVSRAQS